mmetsp:Transcript_44943/g.79647  ORF Transcript_44943/g.79647 Transcript_44943/m.79647 type:complete len:347 (-) Transcript_44943:86-1126(-)
MAAFGCSRPVHADEDAPGTFVSIEKVKEWLDAGSCIVIDTREPVEVTDRNSYGAGMVAGAINIACGEMFFERPELQNRLAPLRASSKNIVCYTEHGVPASRCGVMCAFLNEKHDFPIERLFRLEGGLNAWKEAGYEMCAHKDDVWKKANVKMLTEARPPPPIKSSRGGAIALAGSKAFGCAVTIDGLQSEAGKKLNGQEATVVSYDADKERYTVKLAADGQEKALKADNLTLSPGGHASPTPKASPVAEPPKPAVEPPELAEKAAAPTTMSVMVYISRIVDMKMDVIVPLNSTIADVRKAIAQQDPMQQIQAEDVKLGMSPPSEDDPVNPLPDMFRVSKEMVLECC